MSRWKTETCPNWRRTGNTFQKFQGTARGQLNAGDGTIDSSATTELVEPLVFEAHGVTVSELNATATVEVY